MIKYLGSKKRLVPALGEIAAGIGARTAADLFTGTTRVAGEFKRRGCEVWAADVATYAHVLAQCYIGTDADSVDRAELLAALNHLRGLPARPGYFTETFCERSRFFHPKNGARIDAVRDELDAAFRGSPLFTVLLTSLLLAADRVDSTTGVQMAYLKDWAPRAHNDLDLRLPALLPGAGHAVLGDAEAVAEALPEVDLAYLDPPYNQHRYFTNYHCWETLVRWDSPQHYGVACKRLDSRDQMTKSPFNYRRTMPAALLRVVAAVPARMLVVSYNDESWVDAGELAGMCRGRERVEVLEFDSKRYVGAQIGIHDRNGTKVGAVSRLRNIEYLVLAGPDRDVTAAVRRLRSGSVRDRAAQPTVPG